MLRLESQSILEQKPEAGLSSLRDSDCSGRFSGFIGDDIMKLIDVSTPKHPHTFAQVDNEDYEWLNQWKWTAKATKNNIYAIRSKNNKTIHMHREILKPKKHLDCDHIDGNGLNNQRINLRSCTRTQNLGNSKFCANTSSQYKGVYFHQRARKWMAQIAYNRIKYYLGYFNNEAKAAKAYDKAAIKYFGEFANINFKSEQGDKE